MTYLNNADVVMVVTTGTFTNAITYADRLSGRSDIQ